MKSLFIFIMYRVILLILTASIVLASARPRAVPTLPALVQDGLSLIGQLSGDVSAVVFDGTRAYIGLAQRLVILDVSHPATPIMLGYSMPLPDSIRGIAVTSELSHSFIYAIAGPMLHIINVSDPVRPTPVGSLDMLVAAEEIAVYSAGNGQTYAAMTAGINGLRLVNVTNPTNPVEIAFFDTPGYAWRVAVDVTTVAHHAYAYVVDRLSALRIIDITDPAYPSQVAQYSGYNNNLHGGDVAVAHGYAFLGDYSWLRILNVTDPARPRETRYGGAAIPVGNVVKVALAGNYAFSLGQASDLVVIDVRNPEEPIRSIYQYRTYGEPLDIAGGIQLPGQEIPLVFAASGSRGLQIVTWTDPVHPTALASYDLPSNAYGIAVEIRPDATYAYVTDRDRGLHVVDVTNPTRPVQLATYDTGGMPWNVTLTGTLAYVATGNPGLHLVDVADPAHPSNVGIYDPLPWGADDFVRDVAVAEATAYVSDRAAGALRLVNVSDPTQPADLDRLDTHGGAYSLVTAGHYVFLADGNAGLRIYDASVPDKLSEVGAYQPSGIVVDVTVSGTLAFLSGREDGVHLVDVSNPAQPQLIATRHVAGGSVWGVALAGDIAFLAAGAAGVVAMDVSNPAQPQMLDTYDTPGYAWQVTVAGDFVYVADERGGLLILHRGGRRGYFPFLAR